MIPGLATDKSPPLSLPLRFFLATATALGLIYTGLLAWSAPLAAGNAYGWQARTLTHLFTIAFGSMVIIGALYQLLPVVLGTGMSWPRLARPQSWLYVGGATALLGGFWQQQRWLVIGGGTITALAVWTFVAIALTTIVRTRRRDGKLPLAARFVAVGLVFFLLTVAWGLVLALNWRYRFLPGQLALLAGHAALGLTGWIGLTVAGVSYQLLGMFYLYPGHSERLAHLVLALVTAGGGSIWLAALHPAAAPLRQAGAWAVAAGLALFLFDQLRLASSRRRRAVDLTLRYTYVAWAFLGGAIALFAAAASGLWQPTPGTRAVMAIAWCGLGGWVSLMVVGQLYKILPFLVWVHRFGPRAGREKVPLLRDMYRSGEADAGWWLLVPGTAAIALALGAGQAWLLSAGAVASLAGYVFFVRNIGQVLRTGR